MSKPARRILYVVNAFERDAPTGLTTSVAKAMVRDGWAVAMVAWARGGSAECELDAAGVITGVLHGARPVALAKWIREFRPDIVHSILVRPTLGTLLGRAIVPGRSFLWVAGDHGIHEWHEKGRLAGTVMDFLMPSVLQVADVIVTVSHAAKHQLLQKGLPAGQIHIVPNGVDARVFYPRSRAEKCAVVARHFPNDDPWEVWPLIGSAGNLRAVKGYGHLVAAMSEVLYHWPGARLVVWGDGPERERLERVALDCQVDQQVKFVGRADHIEKLLPLLDLYVQPSQAESFGMAAAEAMCCSVPAVLSDAGGLPELADNGRTARVFDRKHAPDLVHQVLDALSNKPLLQKQGAAGRDWILRNYTSEQMIARMKQVYEQAIVGNRSEDNDAHI